MTAADFRRMALGLSGAIESAHMGHPDFRAGGRIFATLRADMRHGMVKLTPLQQTRFVRASPQSFAPENGAWGLQGATAVTFAAADEESVGAALTLAWQNVSQKQRASRKAAPRDTARPAHRKRKARARTPRARRR
jgi:hypothetical protein